MGGGDEDVLSGGVPITVQYFVVFRGIVVRGTACLQFSQGRTLYIVVFGGNSSEREGLNK